jgi:catechol 2,3-dioxygenase-like lactoylglutathione lyase family enzyme
VRQDGAMIDDRPVLDQVNIVVRDMTAMVEFYRRLGLDIPDYPGAWNDHHRSAVLPKGVDFDLDSSTSAVEWDEAWPRDRTGPVVGFRVKARDTVDSIYADLTSAGYVGEQPPHDAFFGARYAVVRDPEGNPVGIMSARDAAMRREVEPPTG